MSNLLSGERTLRSEKEIRNAIEWLQKQKINKQIAWNMEIALKYTLGETELTFPHNLVLTDEEEFLKELEDAPDGFPKAWGYMMYGALKGLTVAKGDP